MTGRGIDQILHYPVRSQIYENYVKEARDYVALAEKVNGKIPRSVPDDYIWGDAISIWKKRAVDLKIINLETAITTNETYFEKGINYRMHPENTSVLSAAGIDICSLANNHILDWSYEGMNESIQTLNKAHILHSGAGTNLLEAQAPAIFENEEGRVLLFSVAHASSGVPGEWGATEYRGGVFLLSALNDECVETLSQLIKKFKKKDDVIILSIHWGSNWGYDVYKTEINFVHALIDRAQVDIIHGHSSHHPRPIEIYKGRPIFYGCGDFINDYEGIEGYEEYRPELTLMYFVDYQTKPFKLKGVDFDCLKINRFQLKRASVEEADWMQQTLNEICRKFSIEFHLSKENSIYLTPSQGRF